MADSSFVTSNRSASFNDTDNHKAVLEEYKKTCSIIFGKASLSQMKYLQASVELQQSLLNACDSLLAKQTQWLEDNLFQRSDESTTVTSSNLKAFVRVYIATVDMSMNMMSIAYDFTTSQIEGYRNLIDMLNKSYFPP